MLIPSHRHTADDLREWSRLERYDTILARSRELARLEARALGALRAFATQGPCYVGVSWGKDSVVVAHLAWRLYGEGFCLPVVWFPAGRIENPDCALVRDEFLRRFPVDYREIEASGDMAEALSLSEGHDGFQREFETVSRLVGTRYVSGVRADESTSRAMRMRRWGESSQNTCAPIGWWPNHMVFAYLKKHNLPVHPAYACLMGGAREREDLRVGTLGGERGTGRGRRDWERRYYGVELERLTDFDSGST